MPFAQSFAKVCSRSATSWPTHLHWTMMSFGLKNTGATYQRCMLKCFGDLIGQTVEAYVDDIVVKSKWANQVVADLEQTFVKL